MANEFTSVATAGFGDNTVKAAYDLALGYVLRETPQFRQFVDKRPERPSMPGSSVILNKYDWFGSTAVTAAKTPLTEESDVDSTKLPATVPVTLTFNEYGFAVTRTKKLKYFTFADLDMYALQAVGNHLADVMDELVMDVAVTGTQKGFSGGQSAENTLTASHKLTAGDVRKAVTKLRANKAVPWGPSQLYGGMVHPHALHDLREETGSGSWRVPQEYGTDQSMIWSGEFGAFEGVRWVENTRARRTLSGASSAPVYRTFVMGREGIAEGAYEEPNIVLGPVTDKLQRFRTVGWYGVLGWCLYRNEAVYQILSGSSVAAL